MISEHDKYKRSQSTIQSTIQSQNQNQSRSEIETQLLQTILNDNKKITNELKNQLDTNKHLEDENIQLKKKFQQILRESELCIEREELNMKRNVMLVRENKELKKGNHGMVIQIQKMEDDFEKKVDRMRLVFEEERDNMIWHHERLEMNGIKLQTQLDQCTKENVWLNDDNKRLRKMGHGN